MLIAIVLVALGVAAAAAGIHVGDTDDAPGAALIGLVLLLLAIVAAVRIVRRPR